MNKYNKGSAVRSIHLQKTAAEDNIVQFNKQLDEPHLNDALQAIETAKRVRTDLSNDIAEMAVENLMGLLTTYGVFIDHSRIDTRDLIMIENAVQAALFRYYGIDHPLHEVTDDVFQFEDEINDNE